MPITTLPTPPTRTDPDNFAARADALMSALPTFVTEANALADGVNTKEASVNTKYAQALASGLEAAPANAAAAQAGVAAAAAQVSLAAGYATSAASVVQQDLSAALAVALHKTGFAVTQVLVYDTTQDSDGGAWRKRCDHTSWFNEPLNGKWLGTQVSETTARAVSGATTGDYYLRAHAAGQMFALNAGSGITEVQRGNRAEFPAIAGLVVANTDKLYIYDLTQPGWPLWMRFPGASGFNPGTITSLAARNGEVVVAGSLAVQTVSFVGDYMRRRIASACARQNFISTRTSAASKTEIGQVGAGAAGGNSVALTVLPDAPVNPGTGLPALTIAVGHSAGVSVIKHDSQLLSSSQTTDTQSVAIDGTTLHMGLRTATTVVARFVDLTTIAAAWTPTSYPAITLPGGVGDELSVLPAGDQVLHRAGASTQIVTATMLNRGNPAASLKAAIANAYNTGYTVGDTRRVLLCDAFTGPLATPVADRSYKASTALALTGSLNTAAVETGAQMTAVSGWSAANYISEAYSADLDFGTGTWSASAWVRWTAATAGTIFERAGASGPSISLGANASGQLTASAYDGTTTRTVTSAQAYNLDYWVLVQVAYDLNGTLSLKVGDYQTTTATGTPLGTLSNAAATLTVGNNRATTAPWVGAMAMLKIGATNPTPEQIAWRHHEEKALFKAGAQCALPDAGSVLDLQYDAALDRWTAASAANASDWIGLARVAVTAAPSGSYVKASATRGTRLLARSDTSFTVDFSTPARLIREELARRAEDAARIVRTRVSQEADCIGFTANLTSGSASATSVSVTSGTPYEGMTVTGTGIPAGTVIQRINGATYTLSQAASASGTAVAIGQASFVLPVGFTAQSVHSGGARKREGATKDWTRAWDGFRETVLFGTSPGSAVSVQIDMQRI